MRAGQSTPQPVRYEMRLDKDVAVPMQQGEQKGSGWFLHNDPVDRNAASFGGTNTIHTGAGRESYLLLPVLPASQL